METRPARSRGRRRACAGSFVVVGALWAARRPVAVRMAPLWLLLVRHARGARAGAGRARSASGVNSQTSGDHVVSPPPGPNWERGRRPSPASRRRAFRVCGGAGGGATCASPCIFMSRHQASSSLAWSTGAARLAVRCDGRQASAPVAMTIIRIVCRSLRALRRASAERSRQCYRLRSQSVSPRVVRG